MKRTSCPRCGLSSKKKSRRIDRPSPYAGFFQDDASRMHQNLSARPAIEARIRTFVRAVEDELLDFDSDIARVEDALRLLKQERQAGQAFLAHHRDLLIHVHALPSEIVLRIFRHCLQDLPRFNRRGYSLRGPGKPIPWILSTVCRRWRNILEDSPSYWSTLDVSLVPPFPEDALRYGPSLASVGLQQPFLDDALRLSRHVPLHFSLDLGRAQQPNPCIQSFVKHVSRWESIHVSGPRDTFVTLGLGKLGILPILKKLSISPRVTYGRNEGIVNDEEVVDFTAALSPFSNCSRLEELSISVESFFWDRTSVLDTSALSLPWANLSKLTVVFGTFTSHIVRSLLLACPNLRQLDVRGACETDNPFDFDPITYEPLIHSGLTSLTVNNPLDLLEHTKYPALAHLSVTNTTSDEILEFFSQYRYSISHFELLSSTRDIPLHWDSVLSLLPDVVHFTIPLLPCRSLSQSLETYLPNLQTLVFRTHRPLLDFFQNSNVVSLISSILTLQKLEVYSDRTQDWDCFAYGVLKMPVSHNLRASELLPGAVNDMIEASDTMKRLLIFKEKGLEVNINGIPLSDRPAALYM